MNRAKEFLSQYKGTVTETKNGVKIANANTLIDYWGKPHKVECTVEIKQRDGEYSVWFDEKTLEILGGGGMGCKTMDDAIRTAREKLERYCFERKNNEQTSLF